MNKLLEGKKGLVIGIANDHSIAWGITNNLCKEGAQVFLTYQNDSIKKRVEPLSKKVDCLGIFHCDVSSTESIESLKNSIDTKIDFIVHAVAYSDKNELSGKYLNTSKENFLQTLHISSFSLTEITKIFMPLLNDDASIMALSYYGAKKIYAKL